MKLRDYQIEAIRQLRENFKTVKRQVLCLPTGAGKTVVFSEIVRLASTRGTKTLVLTDRVELFKQTYASIERFGVQPKSIKAGEKLNEPICEPIVVAMVETIKRRIKSSQMQSYAPDLLILDEAHKANFTALFNIWPDAKVVGVTATPIGKHFYEYYEAIVQNIGIPELVDREYLVPCRAYQMQDDLSDVKSRAGEYAAESLFAHYDQPKLYDGVLQEWQKRAVVNGKAMKTIIFNVNIEHAEKMHEQFLSAGIGSVCVTSKDSQEERREKIEAFENGIVPVLNNCGIFTTGYDEPSIKCVVMNRATKSLTLFLQCVGRGSRLHPGKKEFLLLDFGMNHDQHGMWSEHRHFKLEPPQKKKKGEAPAKQCNNCLVMVHMSAKVCPHCDTAFPERKKQLQKGQMVEVGTTARRLPEKLIGKKLSELTVEEIGDLQDSKKYSSAFCWRLVRAQGYNSLKRYQMRYDYKNGWLYRQMMDIDNSKYTDRIIVE